MKKIQSQKNRDPQPSDEPSVNWDNITEISRYDTLGSLDSAGLAKLEQAFRSWTRSTKRMDTRASRIRIWLIFLIIRYTGARLNEVLALDIAKDIDVERRIIRLGAQKAPEDVSKREIQVAAEVMEEIDSLIRDGQLSASGNYCLRIDEGHLRRKFYERSSEAGLPRRLASPNSIRKARAIELMQHDVPLPVVQRILGHAGASATASIAAFSEEEIQIAAKHFIEKENKRKTSARNTFFGKIKFVKAGDIQSIVELLTLGGDIITTVVTNNSVERLELRPGAFVVAEVKAPWVIVQKSDSDLSCTAENIFSGSIAGIIQGKLTSEFTVRIHDGTELCSVVTEKSRVKLDLKVSDKVWVMFSSFAVVLRRD